MAENMLKLMPKLDSDHHRIITDVFACFLGKQIRPDEIGLLPIKEVRETLLRGQKSNRDFVNEDWCQKYRELFAALGISFKPGAVGKNFNYTPKVQNPQRR